MEIYVDANEMVLGRLCSYVAKSVINGNKVFVFNAEKAIVSGNPKRIFKLYYERKKRGEPTHGPFYPKRADRILKRAIKGMLPKGPRGRQLLKNVKVYLGMPKEFEGKKITKFKKATLKESNIKKYVTLEEISKFIGGK